MAAPSWDPRQGKALMIRGTQVSVEAYMTRCAAIDALRVLEHRLCRSPSRCVPARVTSQTCHLCMSAPCQQGSHAPMPCRKQEAPWVRGQPSDSSGDDSPAVRPHPLQRGHCPGQLPARPPLPCCLAEPSGLGLCLITSGGGMARLCLGQVFIYLPGFFWGGEAEECGVS